MLLYSVFLLLPSATALVDCVHGFVGRMQASVDASFYNVNDTRMCAAMFCIKVLIHGAFDDDNTFQQGISSRCAYTGGDRQTCSKMVGCSQRSHYDGMKGNFSLCCCQENNCNSPSDVELSTIYGGSRRKKDKVISNLNTASMVSLPFCGLLYSLLHY